MPDYGHQISFGAFLTPTSARPHDVVALAQHAEHVGLDLVAIQDHPYLPQFLDTWTLLSHLAGRTSRIRLAPCVLNLPLRPPAVVARAAASLDLLSGGRFELGLGAGAGAFRDAMEAMGAPRRTPGQAVDELAEAIAVIRALWDTSRSGPVRHPGRRYRLDGAEPGPTPAHPIQIWLGAYQPRMLRLTGRGADGWLPSSSYLPPEQLAAANAVIDASAAAAGRPPAGIRRLYNISGQLDSDGHDPGKGFLHGPVRQWVDDLTGLTRENGISTFILGTDDPQLTSRFAGDIAPAVREAVAAERGRPTPTRDNTTNASTRTAHQAVERHPG
jgi:alkanesulfonate monooxygenase SsuD/methylene tetrahydromethanopterin reductase-like flavin-dependent oxidoreductase (luciferase family)